MKRNGREIKLGLPIWSYFQGPLLITSTIFSNPDPYMVLPFFKLGKHFPSSALYWMYLEFCLNKVLGKPAPVLSLVSPLHTCPEEVRSSMHSFFWWIFDWQPQNFSLCFNYKLTASTRHLSQSFKLHVNMCSCRAIITYYFLAFWIKYSLNKSWKWY